MALPVRIPEQVCWKPVWQVSKLLHALAHSTGTLVILGAALVQFVHCPGKEPCVQWFAEDFRKRVFAPIGRCVAA